MPQRGAQLGSLQVLLPDPEACCQTTHATADAQQGQFCHKPQVNSSDRHACLMLSACQIFFGKSVQHCFDICDLYKLYCVFG